MKCKCGARTLSADATWVAICAEVHTSVRCGRYSRLVATDCLNFKAVPILTITWFDETSLSLFND